MRTSPHPTNRRRAASFLALLVALAALALASPPALGAPTQDNEKWFLDAPRGNQQWVLFRQNRWPDRLYEEFYDPKSVRRIDVDAIEVHSRQRIQYFPKELKPGDVPDWQSDIFVWKITRDKKRFILGRINADGKFVQNEESVETLERSGKFDPFKEGTFWWHLWERFFS